MTAVYPHRSWATNSLLTVWVSVAARLWCMPSFEHLQHVSHLGLTHWGQSCGLRNIPEPWTCLLLTITDCNEIWDLGLRRIFFFLSFPLQLLNFTARWLIQHYWLLRTGHYFFLVMQDSKLDSCSCVVRVINVKFNV